MTPERGILKTSLSKHVATELWSKRQLFRKKGFGDRATGEPGQGEADKRNWRRLWKWKLEHPFSAGSLRGYQRSVLGLEDKQLEIPKRSRTWAELPGPLKSLSYFQAYPIIHPIWVNLVTEGHSLQPLLSIYGTRF